MRLVGMGQEIKLDRNDKSNKTLYRIFLRLAPDNIFEVKIYDGSVTTKLTKTPHIYNYIPIRKIDVVTTDNIINDLIAADVIKDDLSINFAMFKQLARHRDARPVWIFSGASNTGKTFLSNKLSTATLSVFETDSVDVLPDEIYADVVVIGNRNKASFETVMKDLIPRLVGNVELISVVFSDIK